MKADHDLTKMKARKNPYASKLKMKKYMVIEHFFPGCLEAIYDRFHAKGRMLPDGLIYLDSWLSADGDKCFQLMETSDFSLFQQWIEHWKDLGSFEIIELGEKPKVDR